MSLQTMSDTAIQEAMEGAMFEYNYSKAHTDAVEQQYIRLWTEQRKRELQRRGNHG